ncbi:glycosyltransferase [Nakamurella sp. YIM 132087]|uniref:Glycosyltransferase n=1 Tax=Nakamurella alba TaxID=2665158 RepID=A0A7K1FH06_9ACTN|nr:glycosyltransferase [Nakamurella alba]MTD12749.1 glycosyltransferase [Nakamurella alba]
MKRRATDPVPGIVRIYGSVRTAHLERFAVMAPSTVLYRSHRYDYDDSAVAPERRPRRMSRLGTVGHLLRHRYGVAELNEPLVWRRWPDLAAQILAIRLRGGWGRRRTVISAYCIGFSDPAGEIRDRFRVLPAAPVRWAARAIGRVLTRGFDRLAFGTSGSLELYRQLVGARTVDRRAELFEALPAPCDCPADDRQTGELLFVGAFSDRKGIRQLMAGWDEIRSARGDLTLTLIGKGTLADEVTAWAADRPEVTVVIDPPRPEIHRAMRRAAALVLLSQPVGAWREQVGLPITEGLSHGARILATEQTGLAPWLAAHGHVVVDADVGAAGVGRAILAVLDGPPPGESVLADLPAVDQRLAADTWMTRTD